MADEMNTDERAKFEAVWANRPTHGACTPIEGARDKALVEFGFRAGVASLSAAEPAGWKLVPVEPTSQQVKAAADAWLDCGSRLVLNKAAAAVRAGIAAAPALTQGAAIAAGAVLTHEQVSRVVDVLVTRSIEITQNASGIKVEYDPIIMAEALGDALRASHGQAPVGAAPVNPHWDYLKRYWQMGFDGTSLGACTGDAPIKAWREGRAARESMTTPSPQAAQPIACSYGDNGYACCEGGPCRADLHNDGLPAARAAPDAITASVMRDDGGERPAFCLMAAYRSEKDAMDALAMLAAPAAPSTPASGGWISVKDQLPPCRDDQDYIGINSAGFAGIFNAIADIAGNVYCMMETAEDSVSIMSDLSIWKPFNRPLPASPTIEGESNG